MHALMPLVDGVLEHLAWTSTQAVLLIGALWLLGRLLPRLPAATRCALWWLLGAQLLLGLVWQAPLQLPILSPRVTATSTAPANAAPVARLGQGTSPLPTTGMAPARPAADMTQALAHAPFFPWRQLVFAAWLAGLLVQLLAAARQWRQTRHVLRGSRPLTDPHTQALCARQVRQLGLRRCPRLRVSAAIESPQVTGLWHPTVLLPSRQTLAADEQAMALAHELAHLRRGDLWLGWIPVVAQWLFFFHPLVRLATREYALNREAACDAQVLQLQCAAPQDYGRLLLRLGVARPTCSGLAGASPSFHNLKRRLTMLQQTSSAMPRARGWLLVVLVALAGVVPYRVVAASHPTQNADTVAATHANTAVPAVPPVPPVPPALPQPPPPAPPQPPPVLPPPPPPAPPPPPSDYGFNASHVDIHIDSHARQGIALFDGDSVMIYGTDADAAAVKRLRKSNQPMLWFRRGDKAYLIRDKATIEQAKRIYVPVTDLARQQGQLAGEQGKLAGQQAGLAARDAAFAQTQARLAQRQAQFAAKTAARQADLDTRALDAQQRESAAQRRQSDAQRRELAARQRALESEQARLEQKHAALESELGTKRHALEAQQAKLETQQKVLEQRQQQTARKAGQAMSRLIDEAAAKGLAKSVSRD